MRYEEKTFKNEELRLDGNEYANCSFASCSLFYGGSDAVAFSNCRFDQCQWAFVDSASNTLRFMAGLYHGLGQGGRDLIEQLFENIRKSPPPGMTPTDGAPGA